MSKDHYSILLDSFDTPSGTGDGKRPPKDAGWPLGILMLGAGKSQKAA
jgi:hypothetical protein